MAWIEPRCQVSPPLGVATAREAPELIVKGASLVSVQAASLVLEILILNSDPSVWLEEMFQI
jgi:hypothetical protein